jgi:hypothetical protein
MLEATTTINTTPRMEGCSRLSLILSEKKKQRKRRRRSRLI